MKLIKLILNLCCKGKHDKARGRHCIRRRILGRPKASEDKIYTGER